MNHRKELNPYVLFLLGLGIWVLRGQDTDLSVNCIVDTDQKKLIRIHIIISVLKKFLNSMQQKSNFYQNL